MYGREELVEGVARSRAPVLLITGDSGVGKSDVLRRAQERSGAAVAPAPVTLDGSPGNLQRALLDALAGALAAITERRGLHDEIGRLVQQAVLRLAHERANDLAKALGAELLAYTRHKLGAEAGRAITDFINQLTTAGDAAIGARINAASDPSVAQTLIALGDELFGMADGEPLLLALDAAESMTLADRGVLRDLAAKSSQGVRLRLGFATFAGEQRIAVDELLASGPGVQEVIVGGLAPDVVAMWLRDAGLAGQPEARVHRLTGGYPLLIQSVIADVRAGGDIESAPLHRRFAAQTLLSWNALDPAARACARALAVLAEPLPESDCAQLCEMSLAEYADLVERLSRAFIMATVVNGQPWFHEQRRVFVLARLRADERAEACARAAERVLEHVKASNDQGWVQPLADLVAEATPLHSADQRLAAAVELPRSELAVCAALIELAEKQHDFVVRGDDVLRHARAWFGAEGDLVAALRRLAERGLVDLLEKPPVAVVRPAWSLMTLVTLQGRAAREFGRMPMPSLTSMFFALGLRSALGSFERLAYGVGRSSWTTIAHGLLKPRKPYADVRASASLGELNPALLARGRLGGRPLHCAARYGCSSVRDEALRCLEGLSVELLGETLQIDEVLAHPGETIASDRFVVAAERATGRAIDRTSSHGFEFVLDTPSDVAESMNLKARTFATIRALCSPRERVAADLGEPIAWHWLAGDDWVTEVAVRGTGGGAVRHSRMPERETNDPFEIFRLVEAFDLPPDASLSAVRHAAGPNWGNTDPSVAVIGQVTEAMRAFNGTQRPRTMRFDAQELTDALLAARQQSLADARALAETIPILGEWRRQPQPESLYLILIRAAPDRELYVDEFLSGAYETVPSDSGREEVQVAVIDTPDRDEDGAQPEESPRDVLRRRANRLMQAGFGRDMAGGILSRGDAQTLIARLLGYDHADVRFVDDRFTDQT